MGVYSKNAAVLSARNIRRKNEKYLKKQLGNDVSKTELDRLVSDGKLQITGLITKR